MQKKFRIAVVGIGGVGGFYGAKLAQHYAASDNYEVIFIARGEHKAKIAEQGLILDYAGTKETIRPDFVTDNMQELGKLDLVLFCVKSYSLSTVAKALTESIDENTYLLPLLNGIESIEYLSGLYPKSKLLWGCTYIISSVAAPGEVKVQGKLNRLVWGNPELPDEDLALVKQLFDEAGIHNELYADIQDKVWEKFSFISPLGSFTSYTDQPAGNILEQEELTNELRTLIQELNAVAEAKGIHLPEDIVEKNILLLNKFPKDTTSSMHRDYQHNNQTELENLTGYIVREGEKLGVATPVYRKVYEELKKR